MNAPDLRIETTEKTESPGYRAFTLNTYYHAIILGPYPVDGLYNLDFLDLTGLILYKY